MDVTALMEATNAQHIKRQHGVLDSDARPPHGATQELSSFFLCTPMAKQRSAGHDLESILRALKRLSMRIG